VIEEVRIRDLGVIEDAVLPLAPGLTVVTGETGAGKTMVVTGLGLLLGGRADSGAVRTGAARTLVEGRLVLAEGSPAAVRAEEAGAELDDGVLLIARSVGADGRSRAHLGGRQAPIAVLADLAAELVAVHGQSDQQRLLQPARQRAALDRYAGASVGGPLAEYRSAYSRVREVEAQLADLSGRRAELDREAADLRAGLAEVEQVAATPGEDAALAAEIEVLGHADALAAGARAAQLALTGDEQRPESGDALTGLAQARRSLDAVHGHDPGLDALAERVAEASYAVAEVGADLAAYASAVDADPIRLGRVQERLGLIQGLARRHGRSLDEALAWAAAASLRLLDLDGSDERLDALHAESADLRGILAATGQRISQARTVAAARFADAVTAELSALAMPDARLEVSVDQTEDADSGLAVGDRSLAYGPDGLDAVELRLCPHPGAPLRPLQRGASGGELSRVMLAVEVVFGDADPVPTFVFDEVDAGVGGSAAVEVGRRLARLAETAQVLVVTHLPQVAAFADAHLVVEKGADGAVTRSGVAVLDDEGRARELTRMLAGLADSELGRAHAQELLDLAARAKRAGSRG